MKLAPVALLLVCTPAGADVAIKLPATWRDRCAERLDAAATAARMPPGARRDTIPLLREDGSPNPMQLVEYGNAGGPVTAMVGNENERRPDKQWTRKSQAGGRAFVEWFRRAHGMYAKLTLANPSLMKPFRDALDDCLKMGEAK
jgi:hypothetical protein